MYSMLMPYRPRYISPRVSLEGTGGPVSSFYHVLISLYMHFFGSFFLVGSAPLLTIINYTAYPLNSTTFPDWNPSASLTAVAQDNTWALRGYYISENKTVYEITNATGAWAQDRSSS